MQFLLLVYFDENHLDSLPPGDQDEVWRESAQFRDDLKRSGRRVTAKALRPTAEAATLRVRDGRTTAVAGPFAETAEPLGGFVLVEAADREEALRIAETVPAARFGTVEVRAILG